VTAPLLFLGWGNPSRGDDALGPLLCDRLAEVHGSTDGSEVQQDFQLQVEDAMDLDGRRVVVFIDASVSGPAPFEFRAVAPRADGSVTTHAMTPEAVLATAEEVFGCRPAAYVMAVRGEGFELGMHLSCVAAAHLEAAWAVLDTIARADDPLSACESLAKGRLIDRRGPGSSSA
jgi:hydrogenase maturation protease